MTPGFDHDTSGVSILDKTPGEGAATIPRRPARTEAHRQQEPAGAGLKPVSLSTCHDCTRIRTRAQPQVRGFASGGFSVIDKRFDHARTNYPLGDGTRPSLCGLSRDFSTPRRRSRQRARAATGTRTTAPPRWRASRSTAPPAIPWGFAMTYRGEPRGDDVSPRGTPRCGAPPATPGAPGTAVTRYGSSKVVMRPTLLLHRLPRGRSRGAS
jgi:hypothetical protein